MSELKPCPFCGCEDIDEYEGDYGNGVYCMSCGAMMGEQIHKHDFHYDGGRVSYEHARDAWNTRAERTCHDTGECRMFRCSECGFGINDAYLENEADYGIHLDFVNYCPSCGARVVER